MLQSGVLAAQVSSTPAVECDQWKERLLAQHNSTVKTLWRCVRANCRAARRSCNLFKDVTFYGLMIYANFTRLRLNIRPLTPSNKIPRETLIQMDCSRCEWETCQFHLMEKPRTDAFASASVSFEIPSQPKRPPLGVCNLTCSTQTRC